MEHLALAPRLLGSPLSWSLWLVTTLWWGMPQLAGSMLLVEYLTAALIRGNDIVPPSHNLLTMCTANAEQAAIKCLKWALATFNQQGKCLHGPEDASLKMHPHHLDGVHQQEYEMLLRIWQNLAEILMSTINKPLNLHRPGAGHPVCLLQAPHLGWCMSSPL